MPRNGAGTFEILHPVLIGQLRSSAYVNEDFTDMGSELTNSLPLDGQAGMTGAFLGDGGGATAPGISFKDDLNSGFRSAADNEMRWVAGATDRAIFAASGLTTFLNGISVTGSVDISSVIGPQVLSATGQVPLTMRRAENDTTERELATFESGNGTGAKGSLREVGGGANDVATLRYYVNNVKVFEWGSSLFTLAGLLSVGAAGIQASNAGFVDFPEVSAAPSAPAANTARLYAKDVAGRTSVFVKDAAATEIAINDPVNLQIFAASGTWVKPNIGTVALIETWGGGASGSLTASSSVPTGGGSGGSYKRIMLPLASLSAAVSVTVGAGGAARTSPAAGANGGDTNFGAYVVAYGGTGDTSGAGGAGLSGPGLNTDGGLPRGVLGSNTWGFSTFSYSNTANPFGGAGADGSLAAGDGGTSLYGGGGAGRNNEFSSGGDSVFGGGGGGAGDPDGSNGAGGLSVRAGNGGAGGTTTGVAGSVPSGGGGGSGGGGFGVGTSGAGGRGEVRITVW